MKLLFLLLLCPAVSAQESSSQLLKQERFEQALAAADRALAVKPGDKVLLLERALAKRGIARNLQRNEGFDAAIAYLEAHLEHWKLAEAFGETCSWAGREEYGIGVLRASALPATERIVPELRLLDRLRRHDELIARAEEVARTVAWDALEQWQTYARREAAVRSELLGRGDRAKTIALIALVVIGAVVALLYRLAPRAGASGA